MTSPLTPFDAHGQAHRVDVAAKADSHCSALATGTIRMQPATLALITGGSAKKGDVIGVARIAAVQAAKRTAELIPLCHPLPLTRVAVAFEIGGGGVICQRTGTSGRAPGRPAGERQPFSAAQQTAFERGFEVAAAVGDPQHGHLITIDPVDHALGLEEHLAVAPYAQGRQLRRVGSTFGLQRQRVAGLQHLVEHMLGSAGRIRLGDPTHQRSEVLFRPGGDRDPVGFRHRQDQRLNST